MVLEGEHFSAYVPFAARTHLLSRIRRQEPHGKPVPIPNERAQ